MTLLITLATHAAIHQSSDFRISDQGVPRETENGTKQLSVTAMRWAAQIMFTGVARDGKGYDTRAWLEDVLASIRADATPDEFLLLLRERGAKELSRVTTYDNRLS